MGAARPPGEAAGLVLEALGRPGVSPTTPGLAAATGLDRRQVSDAVGRLAERGWATRTTAGTCRLTEKGQEARRAGAAVTSGPRTATGALRRLPDTFRVRLWRSMRIRRAFTAAEVAQDAVRDEVDPVEGARRYIRQLERAGYLVGSAGAVRRTWRLVRDTGPKAPVWSHVRGEMQDDNLRQDGAADARS